MRQQCPVLTMLLATMKDSHLNALSLILCEIVFESGTKYVYKHLHVP